MIAGQTRHKYLNKIIGVLNIENTDMFPKVDLQPIIFEQVYSKEPKDKFDENIVEINYENNDFTKLNFFKADADVISFENDLNNYKF